MVSSSFQWTVRRFDEAIVLGFKVARIIEIIGIDTEEVANSDTGVIVTQI